MDYVILLDFGSTFTKAAVVSRNEKKLIYTFRTPSTVQTDASIGLQICLEQIAKVIGSDALARAQKIASSSAAGGLRMVVIGLTESLSMIAGKNAAYGAGAKVIKAFSHGLRDKDIEEMAQIHPEIILLCGGYEGGASKRVLENARKLAQCPALDMPIVYAGNSGVQAEIRRLFIRPSQPVLLAENIIPSIGKLNIASTVTAVREIFMKRITHMKGFDVVKQYVGDIVMPTPAAVLAGVKLLAEGTETQAGWEQVMLVDMGGATTDVHSVAPQTTLDGIHLIGAPEPIAKRTVEGDIGMRESVGTLVEAANNRRLQELSHLSQENIIQCVQERLNNHAFLSTTAAEQHFEQAAAQEGVRVSVRRHVGRLFAGYVKTAQKVQRGKDLRDVKAIIGTGGPIINSLKPREILQEALQKSDERDVLLPEKAKFYLDSAYICYAAGLLAQRDRDGAFSLLTHSLKPL